MTSIERERKFLVDETPALPDRGLAIRQGYLVSHDGTEVRVRQLGEDANVLTVKLGRGSSRTEVEVPISDEQFDALWPATEGRRIHKVRHRLDGDGGETIEVDVFAGSRRGLVLAEVEFGSAEAMAAYRPPPWFGREVTDDAEYANAALAG